jgi:hypothetical protein
MEVSERRPNGRPHGPLGERTLPKRTLPKRTLPKRTLPERTYLSDNAAI